MDMPGIDKMTEKETAHPSQRQLDKLTGAGPGAALFSTGQSDLTLTPQDSLEAEAGASQAMGEQALVSNLASLARQPSLDTASIKSAGTTSQAASQQPQLHKQAVQRSISRASEASTYSRTTAAAADSWVPTQEWVAAWKTKLPLQTIMRLLQVLVPQVEKICIDKGLTDESEILRFLQHGTLVGLLPVPHPILIRKYQPNPGTAMWFRTYMWGVIYLRNTDPPTWYDTDVKLFEIQRV